MLITLLYSRAIELQVTQKTSQTLGYGHTCYVEDTQPHKPRKVKIQTGVETTVKIDDIKDDGLKFLNPLICKGL